MKKLFLTSMLFLLVACQSSNQQSQDISNSDAPQSTINMRDFFAQPNKLQQPVIYVYKDSVSGAVTYRKIEAFPNNKDTLVNVSEYNKDFKLETISHLRFGKDSLISLGLTNISTDKNGKITKTETKCLECAHPWIRPVNVNYNTARHIYNMNIRGVIVTIKENSRIEKLSLVPAHFTYSADSTIRELTTSQTSTSESILNKKLLLGNEIDYDVKGVGSVIEHSFATAYTPEKILKLQRIISLAQYNQLSGNQVH